jgi:hypothetical protein
MCSAGIARPDQAGFFLPKEQRMSTTQACAHVCTAKPMPFIGTDPAAPGSDRTTIFVHLTGATDALSYECSDRRFWAVDRRAPSDIPPPNALLLDDVLLPETSPVSAPRFAPRHNSQLSYLHGGGLTCIDRHRTRNELEHYPERTGKWVALLQRIDEAGRVWCCNALCVIDDFGWLVEVPTC